LDEVRQALECFARQRHLAAFEITEFNPEKDPDGSRAAALVDLLAGVLATRLEALGAVATAESESEAQQAAREKRAVKPEGAESELPKGEEMEAKPAFPTVVTAPQEPPAPIPGQANEQGATAESVAEGPEAEHGAQPVEAAADEPVGEEIPEASGSEEISAEATTDEPPSRES
jgi:hypothetical protein